MKRTGLTSTSCKLQIVARIAPRACCWEGVALQTPSCFHWLENFALVGEGISALQNMHFCAVQSVITIQAHSADLYSFQNLAAMSTI